MQLSNLANWYQSNSRTIAGIDEAGRGPLAGPVVAAAVVFDFNKVPSGLNDSKKLGSKKREDLYSQIINEALAVGIAEISPRRIDEINILQATLEAMKTAFIEANNKISNMITGALVDGNQRIHFTTSIEQHTVINGDNIFAPIMAASIIAKVHRDRLMINMAEQYPEYGFEKHKGYGTKIHMQALERFGPCSIHRHSFAPVRLCALNI
ncbi:MAG: ribonuclease HII [bacterium]|nr:ribonuclease HII [bacterium]